MLKISRTKCNQIQFPYLTAIECILCALEFKVKQYQRTFTYNLELKIFFEIVDLNQKNKIKSIELDTNRENETKHAIKYINFRLYGLFDFL